MKKLLFTVCSAFILLVQYSCTEIGPPIQLTDEVRLLDTTYLDMNLPDRDFKKVLLEEFTGVNCNNCPKGHDAVHDIEDEMGDTVVTVSIQNDNPLAKPFEGYPDFRTEEGIQISQALGGSFAIPCASVDRVLFPGQNQIVLYSRNSWKTFAQKEAKRSVPCNIKLETDYNETTQKAIIHVEIHFLEDVDTSCNLSIMVIEDHIISPQRLPDNSVDSNYDHRNTLRDMLTPTFGSIVNNTTEKGRVVIREYEYDVPQDFQADELKIVAFVHYIGSGLRVLQTAAVSLK